MFEYRIGDKVRIKSKRWYDSLKDRHGHISGSVVAFGFNESMAKYCGKKCRIISTISTIYHEKEIKKYSLDVDDGYWTWGMDMFDNRSEMEIE